MDTDEESYDEGCGIVIDNGTDTMKAGLAGNDAPRAVFRNLITQ